MGSPGNKPGLEEHQKRVARVESWLDLGVLKALGGEARYRRVDACIIALAVNDTNVRRFRISPGSATPPRLSLWFRAGQVTRPTRNIRLKRGGVAEPDCTTHLLVCQHPPAATYRRAPRVELGRVLVYTKVNTNTLQRHPEATTSSCML